MIAVLAAMTEEMAPLRNGAEVTELYANRVVRIQQTVGENPILLVQTGIGKVNAAVATALVIEKYHPEAIINIGSAGGFAANVRLGDIVVGTDCLHSDADATCFGYAMGQVPKMPPTYPADEALLAAAHKLADEPQFAGLVRFGTIITSDTFMSDPALATRLISTFPQAHAAEMESAAVAQAAYDMGTPCLILRSISDIAGDNAAETFDNNLELAADRAAAFFSALAAAIQA